MLLGMIQHQVCVFNFSIIFKAMEVYEFPLLMRSPGFEFPPLNKVPGYGLTSHDLCMEGQCPNQTRR